MDFRANLGGGGAEKVLKWLRSLSWFFRQIIALLLCPYSCCWLVGLLQTSHTLLAIINLNMPKEHRDHSISRYRYRASPLKCSSSYTRRPSPKIPIETDDNVKEWEEARCPVCMEHPHNAVLLICSSHEKGCRPYMCDTSRRHSNCLDQFRKSFTEETTPSTTSVQEDTNPLTNTTRIEQSESPVHNDNNNSSSSSSNNNNNNVQQHPVSCENPALPKLVCPLCRGKIKTWIVDEPARLFMNGKQRSCSCETCSFNGIYTDLRKHARREHPLVHPSEVAPERERSWRRLERQRDIGDLLSTLQSSFGDDDRGSGSGNGDDDSSVLPIDNGNWLTVFFLIQVFRPDSGLSTRRSWSGYSRARAHLGMRRRSARWGETYDVETGPSSSYRDGDNDSSDDGSGPWRRRGSSSERVERRTSPDSSP